MRAELTSSTIWVELPTSWVRVHATFSSPDALDALQHTVLQLLRRRPRTTDELAVTLGELRPQVVDHALRTLADFGFVHEELKPTPRWMATPSEQVEPPSETPRQGWVALCPASGRVIPNLLDAIRPDAARVDTAEVERLALPGSEREAGRDPTHEALSAAVRAGVHRLGHPEADESGDVNGLVADRDGDGRPVVIRRTCWTRVDLVPTLTGRVQKVFFEPCLVPRSDAERPVSTVLRDWIERQTPELSKRVDERASQLRVELSEVLRVAGLGSVADLEREVERHRRTWFDARPELEQELTRLDEPLRAMLGEAHQLLIVGRQRDQFQQAARLSYASAVERLAQTLGASSATSLQAWKLRWESLLQQERARQRETWSKKSVYVEALSSHGLTNALRPSEKHLQRALTHLDTLSDNIDRPAGAGSSITLWLLPLFLGSDAERRSFAEGMVAAVRRAPRALDYLDTLRAFRDDCAHARSSTMALDRVDELVRETLHALHPWLGPVYSAPRRGD